MFPMGTEERHHNFDVFHHFSLGFHLKQGQTFIPTPAEDQISLQIFVFVFVLFRCFPNTAMTCQFKTKEVQTFLQVVSL